MCFSSLFSFIMFATSRATEQQSQLLQCLSSYSSLYFFTSSSVLSIYLLVVDNEIGALPPAQRVSPCYSSNLLALTHIWSRFEFTKVIKAHKRRVIHLRVKISATSFKPETSHHVEELKELRRKRSYRMQPFEY